VKLCWIADPHIGIKRYGTIDGATGVHSRVLDTIGAFGQAVDYCLTNHISYVIVAGDVFNTRTPANIEREMFSDQISRLIDEGIKVIVIVGNHDVGGLSNNLAPLKNISKDQLRIVIDPEILSLEENVKLLCVPWLSKNKYNCVNANEITEVMENKIVELKKELKFTDLNFFVGHFTLEGGAIGSERFYYMGGDATIPFELLNDKIFTGGVFLGHLHKYQVFDEANPLVGTVINTSIRYIGSLVKADFSEWKDNKGVVITEAYLPCRVSHTFVRIEDRPFVKVELNLVSENGVIPGTTFPSLEGAVVNLKVKILRKDIPTLDLKSWKQAFEKKGMYCLNDLQVEIIDDTKDKLVKFQASLTDLEMLEKFVRDIRKQSNDFVKTMVEEGKKIFEEIV
jgi:exonuclease SbcD